MRKSLLIFTFLFFTSALFAQGSITLKPIGGYETGVFDEGATEISAYDPISRRLFSVNSDSKTVDVISLANPSNPKFLFSIDLSPHGKAANSVAVHWGILAVAVENEDKQKNGKAVFFHTIGQCRYINSVEVGALPDMITFTPDGRYALVANEAEPNDDYDIDPEGSVSIIRVLLRGKILLPKTVDFKVLNNAALDPSIRIFGPGATVAQDLEPEYIAVSKDSRTAWVSCQENNALIKINIRTGKILSITGFGFKDHSLPGNELDASNEDDEINIRNWPTHGMYQPDAIAYYKAEGKSYIVSANEGDARDYDGFSEEDRVKDLVLDPTIFPNADELQLEENLGRLNITTTLGDTDGDGDYDKIFNYGARSFSIWNSEGEQVFDSGSEFENILANLEPENFNSTDNENDSFDNRSDDKGPEPEGVAIGKIKGQTYAFFGLERIGGIMVYNITDPKNPEFVEYINTRNFDGDAEEGTAGDLAPEGIIFIPKLLSPNKKPLLVVSYEVSGSIRVFEISETSENEGNNSDVIASEVEEVLGNYPNPFNPTTNIRFSLAERGEVHLSVFNILGQKVTELVNGTLDKGVHEVTFNAGNLASGTYFYRLQTGSEVKIKRMLLTK